MDREQEAHFVAPFFLFHQLRHFDHRDLDNVGRESLDRHVDRDTLGFGSEPAVRPVDAGEPAAASVEIGHEFILLRLGDRPLLPLFHVGEFLKIPFDEFFRLRDRKPALLRERLRAHAVAHAEIQRLRRGAHFRRYLFERHAVDLRRGELVNVEIFLKSIDHLRIIGDGREHAEFHLRIIEGGHFIALLGDEHPPDLLPPFAADRDILQIRILRTQAPGGGACLDECRMHATFFVGKFTERFHVGGFYFENFPVVQNFLYDRVAVADHIQRFGVGGALPGPRFLDTFVGNFHPVKKHFAQLFRRIEVELAVRLLVDLLHERRQLLLHILRKFPQIRHVYLHALLMHGI